MNERLAADGGKDDSRSSEKERWRFPQTRWSMVLAAGDDGESDRSRAALEELCRRYWLPVYMAIRGSGRGPEDAEDLAQDFFAMLLSRSAFSQPLPERGRFRTFLLAVLNRFLVDDWRKQSAQKRGGEARVISMDREFAERQFEIAGRLDEQPDRLFERQWARQVLDRTIRQMAGVFEQEGKAKQFAVLRPHLATDGREGAYTEISAKLGVTENHARQLIFRLRRRFRRLLREEIAETVGDAGSVEDEVKDMIRIFSRQQR